MRTSLLPKSLTPGFEATTSVPRALFHTRFGEHRAVASGQAFSGFRSPLFGLLSTL